MSTEIFNHADELYVTSCAAPASEGSDRARLEFFTPREPTRLTRNDAYLLCSAILAWIGPHWRPDDR